MPQDNVVDLRTHRNRRKGIDWGAIRARHKREGRETLVHALSALLLHLKHLRRNRRNEALKALWLVIEAQRVRCCDLCAIGADYELCAWFVRQTLPSHKVEAWLDDELWGNA